MLLGNNKKKTQRKPNQICDPITTFVTDKTDAGEGGSYLWIEKLTGIGNGISPFPNSWQGCPLHVEEEGTYMFSLGSSLSEGRENEESMLSLPIVSFQTHGFLMVEKSVT